jgi:Membrane protein involved in the export of O-antigen and teichoic acid
MVTLLKRNTIASLIGSNWPSLLGIVFVPIYIKFMGIESYGLVGLFATVTSLFSLIDMGMSTTLNREMARLSTHEGEDRGQRDLVRTLEWIYWGLSLLAGIIMVVAAPSIAQRWVNPKSLSPETVKQALRLMGFIIALQLPSSFYQGGLMGMQRQVLMNTALVVLATVRGLGVVLILWRVSATIEAFFLWQAVVSGAQVCIMMFLLWRYLPRFPGRPRFKRSLLSGVWRYSAYVSGSSIVGVLLAQMDKIILVKILPLELFGYYILAWTIASALWSIIVPINTALFPQFVQLHERRDEQNLVNLFHHASQVMSVAVIPIGILLILFSKEILFLWTRNPLLAQNTHMIVSLLVFGVMLNGMSSVPGYASSAFGWPQLGMYVNIGQAIFLIPAMLLTVPRFGAEGAAAICVVLNATYMFVMVPIMFRRYLRAEKWKWYLNDVGCPFAGVVVTGVILLMLFPGGLSLPAISLYLGGTLLLLILISIALAPIVRSWLVNVLLTVKLSICSPGGPGR